jgi:hypothetical protein
MNLIVLAESASNPQFLEAKSYRSTTDSIKTLFLIIVRPEFHHRIREIPKLKVNLK